jgi:hypothetical protein
MATINPSNPKSALRGKLGGLVYAQQPNGTITVRSLGVQTVPSTEGEKRGQRRMRLGHGYVHAVLADPTVESAYANEALSRKMRTCDLIMSDFLKDPIIASVDAVKYSGRAGGWLLILTGDDFKVVRVGVVFRNGAGQRIEEGFAVPAQGSTAKVWIYTAQTDLPEGQILSIEVTATDRAGHSTVSAMAQLI